MAVEQAERLKKARDTLRAASQRVAAHLDACVRCGLCGQSCHIYLAEPEPANLPAAKVARVVSLYRRECSVLGRFVPRLVAATELTPASLVELADAVFGRCTACGRCALHCSIGLDVASIIRAGRQVLAAAGMVPDGLQRTVDNQLQTGNQMALPRDELAQTAAWLSEELRAECDDPQADIPIDRPGQRVLYLVNPREIKFFPLSLLAAAGIFHAAGESWTLSSRFYDVTNYGFYAGDDAAARELTDRLMQEAGRLGVQEVVLSECGHGFRSFRWEGPNWLGRRYPLPVRSILELLDEYLTTGRVQVDPGANPDRVTLHDPCNLVRWGGISEPQRRILKRVTRDFVEMTPNRHNNFCCGGGGGMLSMGQYGTRRLASGAVKAEQIRATGAKIVATPCHNCADQLIELSRHYRLGVEIRTVTELIYAAVVRRSTGSQTRRGQPAGTNAS